MRTITIFASFVLLLFCFCSNKTNYAVNNDSIDSNDSVKIEIDSFCLIYDKNIFETIKDSFPQLSKLEKGIIESPDDTYKKYPVYINDYTFDSEAGQDEFYLLYAHFLRKRNGDKYSKVRDNLINIYREINSLFGSLEIIGNYFGHQYVRIVGYAEYDIYLYSPDNKNKQVENNFVVTKRRYLKSLENKVLEDADYYESTDRQEIIQKSHIFIDNLNSLITDEFYLSKAIEFTDNKY